jgi:hypothetical protein
MKAFKVFITFLCIISSFYYAFFAAFRYDVDGYWCPEGTGTTAMITEAAKNNIVLE